MWNLKSLFLYPPFLSHVTPPHPAPSWFCIPFHFITALSQWPSVGHSLLPKLLCYLHKTHFKLPEAHNIGIAGKLHAVFLCYIPKRFCYSFLCFALLCVLWCSHFQEYETVAAGHTLPQTRFGLWVSVSFLPDLAQTETQQGREEGLSWIRKTAGL